jgi:hypothetical protein
MVRMWRLLWKLQMIKTKPIMIWREISWYHKQSNWPANLQN